MQASQPLEPSTTALEGSLLFALVFFNLQDGQFGAKARALNLEARRRRKHGLTSAITSEASEASSSELGWGAGEGPRSSLWWTWDFFMKN